MSRHAAQPVAAAQEAQAGIEVFHGSTWRPASMLSWRTDDGAARILVRLHAEGQTAWMDASSLRAPKSAGDGETQRMNAVGHAACPAPRVPQRWALEADVAGRHKATMRLPLSVAVPPPSRGGRRDAPSTR